MAMGLELVTRLLSHLATIEWGLCWLWGWCWLWVPIPLGDRGMGTVWFMGCPSCLDTVGWGHLNGVGGWLWIWGLLWGW